MDPDVKSKWLTDLRSGEYEQCKGDLKSKDGGFCCLGVLADQFKPTWRKAQGSFEGTNRMVPMLDGEHLSKGPNSGCLNEHFLRKIGLPNDEASQLMSMNDAGSSFSDIATYIERNIA